MWTPKTACTFLILFPVTVIGWFSESRATPEPRSKFRRPKITEMRRTVSKLEPRGSVADSRGILSDNSHDVPATLIISVPCGPGDSADAWNAVLGKRKQKKKKKQTNKRTERPSSDKSYFGGFSFRVLGIVFFFFFYSFHSLIYFSVSDAEVIGDRRERRRRSRGVRPRGTWKTDGRIVLTETRFGSMYKCVCVCVCVGTKK